MSTDSNKESRIKQLSYNDEVSQDQVAAWFNKIYARKGRRYLRPVQAYRIFLSLLQAQSQHRLLDVACGMGCLLEAAAELGCESYGMDISQVALSKTKEYLPAANLALANAQALPYADNSFDLVTCLGSLERMLDLEKVLTELRRVGKDNVKYCFLVRNANTLVWKYFKIGLALRNKQGHQGAKSLSQWRGLFEANGFNIEAIYPDQYPLHKRQKWLSFGMRRIDYTQTATCSAPLESANEFIFLLSKTRE